MCVKYEVGMLDGGRDCASQDGQYAPLMPREGEGVGTGDGGNTIGICGGGSNGVTGTCGEMVVGVGGGASHG